MDRRHRHGRRPCRAQQAQHAGARGQPRGHGPWRPHPAGAGTLPGLPFRGAAAARAAADVQPLRAGHDIRHARGQRHPHHARHQRLAHAGRRVEHAVPVRPRGIRRRRTDHRRPVRHALGEAAGRAHGGVSCLVAASRHAGDGRLPLGLVLLGPVDGQGRQHAHHAVRTRSRHPRRAHAAGRQLRSRAVAGQPLSQPVRRWAEL